MNERRESARLRVEELVPHPAQPPARSRDTRGLEKSLAEVGQLDPIVVASDRRTVLGGWRRTTAARRIGWEAVDAFVTQIAPESAAALDFVIASNEHEPLTSMELVGVLRCYEEHGIAFGEAARRAGVPTGKAKLLAKLAIAPAVVQEAVERYEAGKRDRAISLSAFREIAALSASDQAAVVAGGAVTRGQVKRARQKLADGAREERAIESAGDLARALDAARQIGALARFLVTWRQTARALDAADVETILNQHKEQLAALSA